jgi:hypothetical protein
MSQKFPVALAVLVVAACAAHAPAAIDLEWRPLALTASVNQAFGLGLYAVPDGPQPQAFSSVQVILAWDPACLQLTGHSTAGALGFLGSSFLAGDSFGLNEANPPRDGDAMWVGLGPLGGELLAQPGGSLLTTILFKARQPTPATAVTLLASAQHLPNPAGYTKMLNRQSSDVLGRLGAPVTVTIVPEPAALLLALFSAAFVARGRRTGGRRPRGGDFSRGYRT